MRRRRRRFHLGSAAVGALAVAASALILGQVPRSDPLLPELDFDIGAAAASVRESLRGGHGPSPERHLLNLPRNMKAPSRLHISGRLPETDGRIVIHGHWNAGRWFRIATAPISPQGEYSATIRIRRTGMLNIRIQTPSGDVLVGSTHVRG
jgi:hypothetical protein